MKKVEGAKVLIKTANHLPIISMRWIFAGGAREERPQEYGIANLFQRTWTSGTQNHSALEIALTPLESLRSQPARICGQTHSRP
jgi:predicted Zn-dependent peptidase